MSRNHFDYIASIACIALGLSGVACSGATHDGETDTGEESATSDDALTTGRPSGFAECPGLGWTNSIADWNGVRGSYLRSGSPLAPAGAFTTLTIFADPSEANEGAPRYLRTADNVAQGGRIALGIDNPAIGPAIGFYDEAMKFRDLHWVLAQKKSALGKVTGICLVKAAGADGKSLENEKPYMLTRMGL